MEKVFAAVIVAIIFVGVPLLAGGLLVGLNVVVWLIPLKRRIGEVPKEAFIPGDVTSGLEPLGNFGILVLIAGLILMGIGHWVQLGFLFGLGSIITPVPGVYLLLISMNWIWQGCPQYPYTDEVRTRLNGDRLEKIRVISDVIAQKPDDPSLLTFYYYYWRAAHNAEFIKQAHFLNQDVDTALVDSIRADLSHVLQQKQVNPTLTEQATTETTTFEYFVKEIEKKMAKKEKKMAKKERKQ